MKICKIPILLLAPTRVGLCCASYSLVRNYPFKEVRFEAFLSYIFSTIEQDTREDMREPYLDTNNPALTGTSLLGPVVHDRGWVLPFSVTLLQCRHQLSSECAIIGLFTQVTTTGHASGQSSTFSRSDFLISQ